MAGAIHKSKSKVVLFGLTLALFALFSMLEPSFPSLDLSFRQLLVYPLFILTIYLITTSVEALPKSLVLLAVLAAVSGFIASRASHDVVLDPYLAARLIDDEFENESRVFRAKINNSLGKEQKIKASRYHGPIKNQQEAFKLLKQDPQRLGVVWGSKKWISISFGYKQPLSLEDLGISQDYYSLLQYEMVLYAPVIGLSYSPLNDTSLFIASLMEGLDAANKALDNTGDLEEALLSLKAAGVMKAGWSTMAHRAYPWWMIGNLHLISSLQAEEYEAGVINCAIRAYQYAGAQLRYGDNPELLSAINNNLALAYMVKLSIEGKGEYRKLARRKFRASRGMFSRPNRYKIKFRAPKSAHVNLKLLKQEQAKKRRKRKKGKRHE